MSIVESKILVYVCLVSLAVFAKGFLESYKNKNAYGPTPFLYPFSIFVWGDAVVFGAFWALMSIISLALFDILLFYLVVSLFYLVRSLGETFYWIAEQHAKDKRDNPKKLLLYKVFNNDSVYFIQQTINQCITIISLITSVYLAKLWLAWR